MKLILENGHYPPVDVDSVLEMVTKNMTKIANADYGICSLTSIHSAKGPYNILLWSLYANSHSGYCIEFDTQKLKGYCHEQNLFSAKENKITLDKVIYSKEKAVLHNLNDHDIYFDFLRMQSRCLKHQREWRLIYYKNVNQKVNFPDEVISGIYFGINCSEVNKNIIKAGLRNRTNKVKVYEASYKPVGYALGFSQVD